MMERSSRYLLSSLVVVALAASLYRPLPDTFTDSLFDRGIMYLVEFGLRLAYVYPTRLCPDLQCELDWMRFALEALMKLVGPWSMNDPVVQISNIELDTIPSRVYVPYNRSNDGAIIYIHGGGFTLGTMNMYESVIRQFAKNSRMVTFSLNYRLAPEHIYPAALDDCERMVLAVLKQEYKTYGINKNRIVLMGDSAGAALIAALTYRLRHRNDIVQPKLQVLIYPLMQVHNLHTPSYELYYRELSDTGFVDPRLIVQYYLMYAGVEGKVNEEMTRIALDNRHISYQSRQKVDEIFDFGVVSETFRHGGNITAWPETFDEASSRRLASYLFNPEFAPIMQRDLKGVPPALVVTMEHDILRDEGMIYAERLRQAGIPTTLKHFPTGFHAMINFHNIISTSGRAVKFVSDWTLEHI